MNSTNALRETFLDFIIRGDLGLFNAKLSETEWQIIVKWCKEHRLTYLFIYKIKQSDTLYSRIQNNYLEQLENRAKRAPLRQLKIQANLLHLHRILSEHNIDYQVLKGSVLAFRYYPNSAMRRMRDIDIIVKPMSLSQACELLLEHGYSFGAESQDINYEAYIKSEKHAPHLTHPDFNIVIEVHHRLCRPDSKQENLELSMLPVYWQESEFVTVGNQELPCQTPEMLLAHIIHHSVRENAFNNGPVFVFDLYFLISNGTVCWEKFHAYCDYMALHKEVAIAFSLLVYFYPDIKMGCSLEMIPEAKLLDACKQLMLCDLDQKLYERLSSAMETKSNKDKYTHLKKLLLPTKEKMNQHLNMSLSQFYWLRLPVWWFFLFKLLITQYWGRNKKTQTSNELKMLYRWLNK